ncbi:hypothetical protein COP2_024105 [Malus domestica]
MAEENNAAEGSNGRASTRRRRRTWLKRKEKWLVVLGVVLHAVYMLSIFDIYFKSPIVHGMDPVNPRFSAPAKRLVLLVADGLRADKFFESDSDGNFRAPFLRSVMIEKGRWGVSHARPPTESRPGHVAIIAGFYEDPSAVTKGWKANPVEFDSVFNRSRHTFSYGSPDIVPIFCAALPHTTWNSYPHEFEDFATDASFLDEWSFDQFQSLLNRSKEDQKLKELLLQDNLVVFLHLLGCDSNGHAHRPFSSIYLNNVAVVDSIAERVYNLLEDYYKDNRTAYVFTADHGMHDKGSHGDGHPSNTDTPLVVWGAGVKHPKPVSNHSDCSFRFVDDHMHDAPTPKEWGLHGIERVDVNQADIAPLMSTLLGLPGPVNSVGSLPLDYIDMSKEDEVEAVVANTKQILNQFLRKSQTKEANSLYFKPFKPLADYSSLLDQIEDLISNRDYETARKLSEDLRDLALKGLHYFQTYDWLMLMTVIILGYIGWMTYILLHVLQSYTPLAGYMFRKEQTDHQTDNTRKVQLCGCLFLGLLSIVLFMERSPPLYHAYTSMTVFLWTQIFSEYRFIKALWKELYGRRIDYFVKILATGAFSVFILEFLVNSFTERKLYTWCFLVSGVVSFLYLLKSIPWRSGIPIFACAACWFLSVFTLMPAEIPDNNRLVIWSGVMIIMIGVAARLLDLRTEGRYWLSICNHDKKKPKFPMLFQLQALLVGLSSVMVSISTSHRTENQELLALHQIINWSIAGFSMILPLFSANGLLSRLTSIFLGFAPTFLLLSIGYEAVFYGALALVLISWILVENTLIYSSKVRRLSSSFSGMEENVILDGRYLQLSDVRIPLIFMVLFNVAFFGTGNFASIASFEISSVYRFITVFSPFLMAALLIFKLFIPFLLVICVFSAITKLNRLPRLACYFLVILFSDVMTMHFFFLVRNTGSWMEIGNSISHFGIMSAQVVFVLLLFALTNIYTKDIDIGSVDRSSRKAIISTAGLELAYLLVTSLLRQSWDAVQKQKIRTAADPNAQMALYDISETKHPNTTIISFLTPPVTLQDQQAMIPSTTLKDTNFPLFEFLCNKGTPNFSVNELAINFFAVNFNILNQLLTNLVDISSNSDSLILITGHSFGGCVATLFTLWLLQSLDLSKVKRPLCITFGSPLIGDGNLRQCVLQFSKWSSCFLNVASINDPVPKVFLTASQASDYKPFGTFLLCSASGCSCFEDPNAILQLLVETSSQSAQIQGPNSGIQFFDYGQILSDLKLKAFSRDVFELVEEDRFPLKAGIKTQLAAIFGVNSSQSLQQQRPDINFGNLIQKMETQERQHANQKKQVYSSFGKLNEIKKYMAYMEWYKGHSKTMGIGYYDSYKNKGNTYDNDAEGLKNKLSRYWQDTVEEVERKPQEEV